MVGICKNSLSQAFQFSQFYSSPTLLAPSFAGSSDGGRVVFNYRNQWPDIKNQFSPTGGKFVSYAAAFDQYLRSVKSGVGLYVMRDVAGSGNLALTDVGISYAYFGIQKNKGRSRDYWAVVPGLTFKYSRRSLDFYKLVFGDQINPDGKIEPTSTEVAKFNNNGKSYIDAAASLIAYYNVFWLGYCGDHLLNPNQSLMGADDKIAMKHSIFGGARKILKSGRATNKRVGSVTGSFLYKQSGGYSQLDLGAYLAYEPFILGMWFRGLPGFSQHSKLDAIVALVGFEMNDIRIGYSFDFTISKLIGNTGGSHEFSISYEFNKKINPRTKQRYASIPCTYSPPKW